MTEVIPEPSIDPASNMLPQLQPRMKLEVEQTPPKPEENALELVWGVDQSLPFVTPWVEGSYQLLRDLDEESPSIRQLQAMRRTDGQARALYRLVTLPIRSALKTATFEPSDGGDKEAEFIEQMFMLPPNGGGMKETMSQFMAYVLRALFDGFAAFEQIYWSPTTGPLKGKITLQKIAYRPPETLTFLLNDAGDFQGFRQQTSYLGRVIDKKIAPENSFYYACLAGETKIALLGGADAPIKDLVEKENVWVYSIDRKGNVVPGKVKRTWKTGTRKVLGVRLDNDEIVRCTPDHRWMLRSGKYVEAQELVTGDSLMPLYRRHHGLGQSKKLYEQVYDPATGAWKWSHRVVADHFYGPGKKGWVTHHVDWDAFNNHPDNLVRITQDEHYAIHKGFAEASSVALKNLWADPEWRDENRRKIKEALGRPEVRAKIDAIWTEALRLQASERMKANNKHGRYDVTFEVIDAEFCENPRKLKDIAAHFAVDPQAIRIRVKSAGFATWTEYVKSREEFGTYSPVISDEVRQRNSEKMKLQLAEQWADPEYRKARSAQASAQLTAHWSDPENKIKHSEAMKAHWADEDWRAKRPKIYDTMDKRWQDPVWREEQLRQIEENTDGEVMNHKVVEVIELGIEDVYDMEVEEHHNFALSAGAFVHNCQEEENKFYGKSMFESAFYSYDKRVKLQFIMHLAAQRHAVSTRVGEYPPAASVKERMKFNTQLANIGMAQWMSYGTGYKVSNLTEQGTFDYLSLINFHNSQMSKSVLAAFFDANQGAGQGDAKLVDFTTESDGMFTQMLTAIMDEIAEKINNDLIPKFIDWNFGTGKYPQFTWGTLTDEAKQIINQLFSTLAVSPAPNCTPEFMRALEEHMNNELGLGIDYDEVQKREDEEAQQQADQEQAQAESYQQTSGFGDQGAPSAQPGQEGAPAPATADQSQPPTSGQGASDTPPLSGAGQGDQGQNEDDEQGGSGNVGLSASVDGVPIVPMDISDVDMNQLAKDILLELKSS